nr:hypothetical protein GCM10020092_035560 [Actinoplanes digitatis]
MVDDVEHRPGQHDADDADDQRGGQAEQRPDPDREASSGGADRGDARVGADAQQHEEEEDALAGGVASGQRGEVGDGERAALRRGDLAEQRLGHGGGGLGVRLGDQELGAVRVRHERADERAVAQRVRRGVAGGDRAHVERVARALPDPGGERPRGLVRADDGHVQVPGVRLVEGAQIGEAHAEAHQQRRHQVQGDVADGAPRAGRGLVMCGPEGELVNTTYGKL